jgi:hypothetical protein
MKNVASYALYGNRRFYWQGLRSLVRAHHNIFPGWELRIHHDSTIHAPRSTILRKYAEAGLVKLVQVEESKAYCRSMLWRLLPVWEDDVGYVLCRDIDSMPTIKDRRMTEQFIKSGAAIHCMNDNGSHTSAMMGGMCSINGPSFRQKSGYAKWEDLIILRNDLDRVMGGVDQILLHYHVWEKMFPDVCEHRLKGLAPHAGARASFTTVEPVDIAGIPQKLQEETDALIPFMGCPGYDCERAVAFFDEHGNQDLTRQLREIEEPIKKTIVFSSEEPRKIALIAADENNTYDFFLPLTCEMWKRIGYHPYVILVSDRQFQTNARTRLVLQKVQETDAKFMFLPEIESFKTHNLAQVSRLYGGLLDLDDNTLIITSDTDMWPLSSTMWADDDPTFSLWNFEGCDGFFICYCRGTVADWRRIMRLNKHAYIHEELKYQLEAGIGRGNENWGYDENLLNVRLREAPDFNGFRIIKRPVDPVTSLPVGRIDRAGWQISWERSVTNPVDSHLIRPGWHPEYWPRVYPLFEAFLPEKIAWAQEYHQLYVNSNQ